MDNIDKEQAIGEPELSPYCKQVDIEQDEDKVI